MPGELQGRVSIIEEGARHALVSAETFNRVARLLKYLSSSSLKIDVGSNGGLRIETTSQGGGGGGSSSDTAGQKGPFWTELDDGRLTLMNGDNEDDKVAGVIRCGIRNFSIKKQTFGRRQGTLYVYVRYNNGEYTSGATFADELPYVPGKRTWTARIATVTKDNGEYILSRIHHGSDLDVLGRWT